MVLINARFSWFIQKLIHEGSHYTQPLSNDKILPENPPKTTNREQIQQVSDLLHWRNCPGCSWNFNCIANQQLERG